VLQVQQPQQRVDRDRRAAKPTVTQAPPWGEEALVVQIGVDASELSGQPLGLLRQQQLPDRGLRIGLAQHQRPPTDTAAAESQPCHSTTNRTHLPAFPQLKHYLDRGFFRGK
jgi:hypothetical protein